MRLDRCIQLKTPLSRQQVRLQLAQGRVTVNGQQISDPAVEIDRFSTVTLDGSVLQGQPAIYLMMNKPAGIVSATEHPDHRTVLDLLPEAMRQGLHLAGRLDLKTTGLLLLTNDGQWSRRVTQPESRIAKVYDVTTRDPVAAETEQVFQNGIYFSYEDITTLPAELQRIEPNRSRLTIYEGRYHQVKRMFGYFRNEVIGLHREQVGSLMLDPRLEPGQYRELSREEIALF